jgi:hypothetical protein
MSTLLGVSVIVEALALIIVGVVLWDLRYMLLSEFFRR